MKKLTFQIAAVAFMAVGMLFTSCSKEGPEGPAGPAGAAGPSGAQGPAGAKGDPGTANVIYSQWLDVSFDENGIAIISAPGLSKEILNSGSVKVYWNLNTEDDPFVVSLPCSVIASILFDVEETAPNIFIDPYFSEDEIILTSNYNVSSEQGISQFRYILIPGGTPAARKASGIDWNDYNAVKKYLNLKD
ncbi:hypothetical protein [Agriterribacter sp.]|uniref:hypothetical protein n=1 Tax=Agriterribacter sp. TaxID=2821509 RepID=UPI002C1F7929|nr:hypothetical protein [Agriterribacter sp.]HRO46800.1 hypothetical protein [Agriterribacter sp.]HRQ15591.1 hypothetical protein [Agriterribacter sp.]